MQIFSKLRDEYRLRRKMLIHRSEVSLRSFAWSSRMKNSAEEINSLITNGHAQLSVDPKVTLEVRRIPALCVALAKSMPRLMLEYNCQDVVAAKRSQLEDMAGQRTSSGPGRFSASGKGVQIGAVPDRGGRPEEMRVEADMPSFKPRTITEGGSGGGGYRYALI